MARPARTNVAPKKGAAQKPLAGKPATLTDAQRARLEQSKLLRTPQVRALWPHLSKRQQQYIHAPEKTVGHRYPLTSGEVAELTGLSPRQIRYWADHGLVPSWRSGTRRLFESVGLVVAFALTNTRQNELQFYRVMLDEPVDHLQARISLLTSVLLTRLDEAAPEEARVIEDTLSQLTKR
jgi:DNA-binding transcriptional MerR regulator